MNNYKNLLIFFFFLGFSCVERVRETNLTDKTITEASITKEADFIEGKVIKIADGDTFTLIFENGFDVRVRLNGIDSPEKKQAFSKRAKQTLSDLIYDKTVTVYYKSKDRYGRVLGDVSINDLNVNQEMVRRGMAWHFKRYSDDEELAKLEVEARKNKVGLWADPNAVAPWEFRKK
ncbi:MAG: thermonuclease family protein [Bacteroidetes bacterium]|nr:thermonuclease family protein [Bacteroidota bacterium]